MAAAAAAAEVEEEEGGEEEEEEEEKFIREQLTQRHRQQHRPRFGRGFG